MKLTIEFSTMAELREQVTAAYHELCGDADPEPTHRGIIPEQPAPTPPSNVTVLPTATEEAAEADADERDSVTDSEDAVKALRTKFEAVIADDYDAASEMLHTLDVSNFSEAIHASKGTELLKLIEVHAG